MADSWPVINDPFFNEAKPKAKLLSLSLRSLRICWTSTSLSEDSCPTVLDGRPSAESSEAPSVASSFRPKTAWRCERGGPNGEVSFWTEGRLASPPSGIDVVPLEADDVGAACESWKTAWRWCDKSLWTEGRLVSPPSVIDVVPLEADDVGAACESWKTAWRWCDKSLWTEGRLASPPSGIDVVPLEADDVGAACESWKTAWRWCDKSLWTEGRLASPPSGIDVVPLEADDVGAACESWKTAWRWCDKSLWTEGRLASPPSGIDVVPLEADDLRAACESCKTARKYDKPLWTECSSTSADLSGRSTCASFLSTPFKCKEYSGSLGSRKYTSFKLGPELWDPSSVLELPTLSGWKELERSCNSRNISCGTKISGDLTFHLSA